MPDRTGFAHHRPSSLTQAAKVFFVLLLLAGCGRMQPPAPDDGYSVSLASEPASPAVGAGTLLITLRDASGQPVEGARLEVEGNMSHAGMIPVAGAVQSAEAGEYRVAIEWTMAGDWFVDVKFSLPDGAAVTRRFPIGVR